MLPVVQARTYYTEYTKTNTQNSQRLQKLNTKIKKKEEEEKEKGKLSINKWANKLNSSHFKRGDTNGQ